jgi:transaldolase
MGINPQLKALSQLGQSIWYDNLSRDVLGSGELASLLDSGVLGLTSNPAIFKKSIAESNDYDQEIVNLGGTSTLGVEELCEELMMQDVAAAADLLRPIYDSTGGVDGFASIEVSPFLAHDTQATIQAAQRIWKTLARPNIMIKIPATVEGIPAIEETLASGINVNVTLIFSVEVYRQVAQAYTSAFKRRIAQGLRVDRLASVASFFVSRVDALCDKRFEEAVVAGKATEDDKAAFFGKVGIANSKVAYAAFEEIFRGLEFKELEAKGARVQRPLWASTGTKHPSLSPVLYVEELAGKDTVNTLPPATLKATMQSATIEPRLHSVLTKSGLEESQSVINGLSAFSIYFSELLLDLQVQGVKLFVDAYQQLLDSLDEKSARLISKK